MSDAQIQQMVDVFQYYGQGTAKIPEDLVKAHRLDQSHTNYQFTLVKNFQNQTISPTPLIKSGQKVSQAFRPGFFDLFC